MYCSDPRIIHAPNGNTPNVGPNVPNDFVGRGKGGKGLPNLRFIASIHKNLISYPIALVHRDPTPCIRKSKSRKALKAAESVVKTKFQEMVES